MILCIVFIPYLLSFKIYNPHIIIIKYMSLEYIFINIIITHSNGFYIEYIYITRLTVIKLRSAAHNQPHHNQMHFIIYPKNK